MNFYYAFIAPNRSLIEFDKGNAVLQRLAESFSGYTSFWWERLCREAVSGAEINGYTFGLASGWWGTVSKKERIGIDVVAESLDGTTILIGECKWTEKENASRLIYELEERILKLPFAKGKRVIPCLFLKTNPSDKITQKVFLPEDIVAMIK